MAKLCEGRVVIVTGAGRGIGREHALMLAAHGARVVVNDLGGARDGTGASSIPAGEVVAEIRAAGGEAVANADDVSDWQGAERLIRHAVDAFGGLDVLVNNAGIAPVPPSLREVTPELFDKTIAVNLKGPLRLTALAAEHMTAGGTVINIQTPAGQRAIAVRVDQISGVGTVIKTGDYADAIISLTEEQFASVTQDPANPKQVIVTNPGPKGATVKLIVQGMQVLGTLLPPVAPPPANAEPSPSAAT